jgi:two-component system KDP operon response regulator KdpE
MDKKHILIVDDDPAILRLLSTNLKARGYEIITAADGEESLEAVQKDFIDLIILDLMMPKVDGVEVCRRVREWSDIPIIILSKPFGIAELMARIKTAFRHRGDPTVAPAQSSFTCDGLEINFAKRRVTVEGKEITLTPTEYALLQHLAVNSDKVLTHSMLLQSVWGSEYSSEKEYLRVFVGRLRRKLEPDPKNPKYIQTIPGVGYHIASISSAVPAAPAAPAAV